MDSSRRAVESYWRSRMIDGATSDEDKVTPVYKLEEICELLRSSHVGIVKEVLEFILKRLEHKSPVVKQKALRLIKYAVGKSGVEFRREMQRHSVAVRNLFHYKGQPDPLKGDALNKAVRDMAHEALTAIFASEDSKPAPTEELGGRIQGFGNTNFEMPSDDKKSFLSEVVELGSATIKQGISGLAQGHGLSGFAQVQMQKKTDNGSYKGPNLRRSLTAEIDYSDNRYEPVKEHYQNHNSFGSSRGATSGPWNAESRITKSDTAAEESSSSYSQSKTREERLLETIVTTGGVRLQPTRDSIRVFLVEAAKLDTVALCHALELKLQSPQWQVRVKAICVLDAILRKKDDGLFSSTASYFSENKDVVIRCCESPQASLREKAIKVLNLLGGEQTAGQMANSEKQMKTEANSTVHMPDLIDTADSDDFDVTGGKTNGTNENNGSNMTTSPAPVIDDLFGDSLVTSVSNSDQQNDDDPFADVSFHNNEGSKNVDDLFSGMTVDNKGGSAENHIASNQSRPELFDILGSGPEIQRHESHKNDVDNLMIGLSITDKQKENTSQAFSGTNIVDLSSHPSSKVPNDALSGLAGDQAGLNSNAFFASNTLQYSLPPGLVLNPGFPAQRITYGPMGNYFAQQQLLATMSNFQHFGNLGSQSAGFSHVPGTKGGNSAPLPDIFQSNLSVQMPSSLVDNTKKEDTRAFDFISDHIAAARDPKRVA